MRMFFRYGMDSAEQKQALVLRRRVEGDRTAKGIPK